MPRKVFSAPWLVWYFSSLVNFSDTKFGFINICSPFAIKINSLLIFIEGLNLELKKYKFLFTINPKTATDGIIANGATNILKHVFGEYEIKVANEPPGKFDLEDLPDACFYPAEKFDAIIILGTPWLWDQFYKSKKYRNLMRLFKLHKNTPRVYMGVGSCLLLNDNGVDILTRKSEAKNIRNMMSGPINIVRDRLAKDALDAVGVKSCLLPCPSYFCYGLEPIEPIKSDKNILIWYNPLTGISNCYWKNKKELNRYTAIIKDFYNAYKPEVYCAVNMPSHYDEDLIWAKKLGLPNPVILKDYEHTKKVIMGAGKVLSGRVHCSVPAFVQGKPIGILPIDSRARVLTDFGCQAIVNNLKPFRSMEFKKRDFSKYLKEYEIMLSAIKDGKTKS